jgi:hypothetical protein
MDPIVSAAVVNSSKDLLPEVYKDGLQPTVQEVGKNLHTVSKLVTIALTPISVMVWSYEKIKEQFIPILEKKLSNVPEENITTPEPEIAVPAIEALRYTGHNDDLREMFANLLATAMDNRIAPKAHPSFVEIIKQINSDEAKIINMLDANRTYSIIKVRLYDPKASIENSFAEPITNFSDLPNEAGCSHHDLGSSYIENLERLGLINISYSVFNTNPNAYEKIENHPLVNAWRVKSEQLGRRFEINRGAITPTEFGKKFIESCVLTK